MATSVHLLEFTYHLLDKRYELMYRNDDKVRTIITVTSILLAVGTVVFEELAEPSLRILLGVAFLFGFTAIFTCLRSLIPKVPPDDCSVRTIKGTARFDSPELYVSNLSNMTSNGLVLANADHVLRLGKRCIEQYILIKRSAYLVGLSFGLTALVLILNMVD
ncbi:MAG: hypothetical protein KY456_10545 [Chloroflexi bacterium]|nr:hypothetical protein [Chloroflexota bacterium]